MMQEILVGRNYQLGIIFLVSSINVAQQVIVNSGLISVHVQISVAN